MKQALARLRSELDRLYPPGEREAIIRLIFDHLKGWSPVDIVLNEDKPLSEYMRGKVEAILARLLQHEPIQYVLGEARFYGLNLKVTPAVLVPRPETEELVEMIVRDAQGRTDLQVLDAGTGSGCIAVALARNLKFPQVTAIDVSEAALQVARDNAASLKCRITFRRQDMLQMPAEQDCWDIIASNPPYIGESEAVAMEANVLDYEPRCALFVPDNDPLLFYRALADYGRLALKQTGRLYFEINPLYADELQRLLADRGYTDIETVRDIHGRLRFMRASQSAR